MKAKGFCFLSEFVGNLLFTNLSLRFIEGVDFDLTEGIFGAAFDSLFLCSLNCYFCQYI